MSTEFVKLSPDVARSVQGFTVVFHPEGGVDYTDSISGHLRIATELYQRPLRYVIYGNSADLGGMSTARADEILANVKRAIDFLGRPSEISR
jgi:hypothetical protein